MDQGAATTTARTSGPTALADRALGPDLARGAMLLAIALANSHYFLTGERIRGGFPLDGSATDRVVTWLVATFVDGRAFPMFGLLFGYGVARIVARRADRGSSRWAVRRLLWRRSLVLVGVGLVDGLLFFVGDILAMYGVLLAVGAFAVFWRDRWLLVVAGLFTALNLLPGEDSMSTSTAGPDASMLPPDPASMVADRLPVVGFVALLGPLGFAAPFLVGLWAGRRRVLERVAEHRRLLWVTAVVGIATGALGAQPVALWLAGVVSQPEGVVPLIGSLHDGTGLAAGAGYAAALTLLAAHLQSAGPPLPRFVAMVAATGQRSMTCYLVQSVAWAVLFTPFLLDLSGTLSVTSLALVAVAVWLLSALLATQLSRRGSRGPFELLVRKVTYGVAATRAEPRPTLSA